MEQSPHVGAYSLSALRGTPCFIKPLGSLLYSQEYVIDPYPEPSESISHPHTIVH